MFDEFFALMSGFGRVMRTIIGAIVGFIRNRVNDARATRQVNQLYDQNDSNRNVVEYNSCPIEAFIPSGQWENIVASGENDALRNRISCAAAFRCYEAGRGAVILHFGNTALEALVQNVFNGANGLRVINAQNREYDPFVGMNSNEITRFVLSSSGNDYKVERLGGSFTNGLGGYIRLEGRPLCAEAYYNCMCERGFDSESFWASHRNEGGSVYSEIQRGAMESWSVENYFGTLVQQGEHILVAENRARHATNIKSALERGEVIMIDLGDAANRLLINVIVQDIKSAMSENLAFSLITDSLPLSSSEMLGQLFRSFAGRCTYVYSSADVYADTESNQNLFETLTGRAQSVFVMRHTSSTSSQRFSSFFGNYYRNEMSESYQRGTTRHMYGQVLGAPSSSQTVNVNHVERARLEEREISGQGRDHVYIKQSRNVNNEIISVNCTSGNARESYAAPTRAARQPSSRVRTGINWLIFIPLFIFVMPAAFIYSFFKTRAFGKIVSVILFVFSLLYVLEAWGIMPYILQLVR